MSSIVEVVLSNVLSWAPPLLVGQGQLIFKVVKPVIDRRGRQHQHFCLYACTDNPIEQLEIAVITRILIILIRCDLTAITEIMALVYHDKVEVSPVYAFKVISV